MNVDHLTPRPVLCEPFRRNRERFIPARPGCYVLTTFSRTVLYIGLTNNLRRRVNEHLDNPAKVSATEHGRAVLFFWLETDELHKVERTWLNIHIQHEGVMPELNRVYSPTST